MVRISTDMYLMGLALRAAQHALKKGEVPVGAIIVDEQGVLVARGHNAIEQAKCQTAHAEVRAIELACRKRNNWRLDDCTLYVTLEPCLMCAGLIGLSRIKRVVYGATSPLFGSGIDKLPESSIYKKAVFIHGGVRASECASLLKAFFQLTRQVHKGET